MMVMESEVQQIKETMKSMNEEIDFIAKALLDKSDAPLLPPPAGTNEELCELVNHEALVRIIDKLDVLRCLYWYVNLI